MGKDLKGKELGRGLSQRPDGRYMARAQVEGKSIVLYGWKLKELKKNWLLLLMKQNGVIYYQGWMENLLR